ncbi:MAG: DUF2306 domain-containing protein [Hymenobacter sp.]|nr:MAG: DUF2306 domain-containing protein [Hymenobacter sp.]
MDYLHQHWLTSQTFVGAAHFISASLGLLLGLGVLFLQPGSKLHKTAGYVFVPVLLLVNLSAVFIHQMGFRWGPFHMLIPFSLWALYQGMRPFYQKKQLDYPTKMRYHVRGMVSGALGLWAAFTAEFTVRTPAIGHFLGMLPFDKFWVLTIQGLSIALFFRYLIRIMSNYQLRRLFSTQLA